MGIAVGFDGITDTVTGKMIAQSPVHSHQIFLDAFPGIEIKRRAVSMGQTLQKVRILNQIQKWMHEYSLNSLMPNLFNNQGKVIKIKSPPGG